MLSLFFIAAPASGATASDRNQAKEARKACLAGDYTRGVRILADLFVETRETVFIFNQGRCFEQNRRYEDAIGRFEEYLRVGETAGIAAEDRASAEKHIAECKTHLPESTKEGLATAPPPVAPNEETTPIRESNPELVERPQPLEKPKTSRLVTAGIVVGAVGVVAVGAGIAFNLKVNSMVTNMQTQVDQYNQSKDSNRKTYETLGWVGYGVGAACIATGAVLIAVGSSSRSRSTRIALVPTVGPEHAGVLLGGAF